MVKVSNNYIVEIEKLIPGGKGLCRLNGKAVFVPYVLPGERVEISIVSEKKNYSEADLIGVIDKSPHRIEPKCPLYGRCGGCNMQHMTDDFQVHSKSEFASEHLKRNGGLDFKDIDVEKSKPYEYRNRVQVHFSHDSKGFKERSSNKIIAVEHCPVVSKGINNYLKESKLHNEERITVFGLDGWYSTEEEKKDISVQIEDKLIQFNSSLFFQSNVSMLPILSEYIGKNLEGKNLLDLYCGVGLLSSFAQDKFDTIEAVELNPHVSPYIDRNIAKEHKFFPLSLEKWIDTRGRKVKSDTIIIDPPRTGLSKKVRQYLSYGKAEKILYVSCDPATMSRDLKELLADKYDMKDFRLLDFYPQTSHMEAVALLQKK